MGIKVQEVEKKKKTIEIDSDILAKQIYLSKNIFKHVATTLLLLYVTHPKWRKNYSEPNKKKKCGPPHHYSLNGYGSDALLLGNARFQQMHTMKLIYHR